MAFLRIKKIKGHEYVYVSENRWMKRTSKVRQTTKKYIGRLFRLNKTDEIGFFDFHKIADIPLYFESKGKEELIYDVIRWELYRHGFTKKRNCWKKNDIYINLRLKKVLNQDKEAVLGINEGYLSSHTISRLIRFKAYSPSDAYEFARLFVESGLDVPKEVIVEIFNRFDIAEE